jgi:prepilin-type N-terminal cleavage/methylation domain-containing protein/prepilin-type processing-associated H-X9-DG protein
MVARWEADPAMRSGSDLRSGLTLIELLVVIAIIGIVLALTIPAVQMARESSRRTACKNNLRQIGLGLQNFESTHRKFPPGKKWSGPSTSPTSFAMAWSALILEHIEQRPLQDQINFKLAFTDPSNLPATTQTIPIYLCPSTGRFEAHRTAKGRLTNLGSLPGNGLACIDYMGISGPDKDAKNPLSHLVYGRQRGVLIGTKGLALAPELTEPPPVRMASITDGLSNTICVTECTGRGVAMKDGAIDALHGAWASGNNVSHVDGNINGKTPKAWYSEQIYSDHPGGAHVLMCDGSVHYAPKHTDDTLIRSLCSRDGQEAVPNNPFGG